MKLGILDGFNKDCTNNYINACTELNIDFVLIDLYANDWLQQIQNSDADGFLCRPPCSIQERKTIYDERLYFISHFLNKKIYPSYDENFIYENKRNMYSWLSLYNFPHVKTNIFVRKNDALKFIEQSRFPLIIKSNIGASGSGVFKLKNKSQANKFIRKSFGYFNGAFALGILPKKKKFAMNIPLLGHAQKHFLIFQDWIECKWEWRIIKIGNSYFGYKKLIGKTGFASGSLLDGWGEPPLELLKLATKVCETGNFNSMAIDILESLDGKFYINELQCIFGAYNPSQMYIDEKPCRYIYDGKDYKLEFGYFCQNGCANLRVEHFLDLLSK
ncbi:TPA: hypothetical protein U2M30_003696 [Providencia stuartii]|uniref:ATP-grasp domain-containing protein n=2 Tax=Providencia stuartii TaxID=588 RepID=UPI0009755F16|nr:hypothetical protein [Providencia stuartii]OMH50089.1 hypothetical protein BTZ17_19485 [Providencia stuartii]QET98387.1 hypothetical protein FOB53_14510 [Providencia stuartii]HEM8145444.1 hypothetical protein [Providencia stuartii]HEM8876057.1 hypothetical protein [Providencia stuartii]